MRTRRGHRDNVADAATKDFVALRVLTALVEHGEFLTSRSAARELLRCGLVCKSWKKAADHETVWARLAYRSSPALTTAPADQPPLPILTEDGERFSLTRESRRARSGHFAASILTPFVTPTAPAGARATSAKEICRHRVLAGRHADRTRRRIQDPRRSRANLYSCTTAGPGAVHRGTWGAAAPLDLAEVSFILEVSEIDAERRLRQEYIDDWRRDHFRAVDQARARGEMHEWFNDHESSIPTEDYLTDKLRHAFAAPPHFAEIDLGRNRYTGRSETCNLVWAATVRAYRDDDPNHEGDVAGYTQLVWEGRDEGMKRRRYTCPVSVGSEDYHSAWCGAWRIVVTAVKDADGTCCQLADVRGGLVEPELECNAEARFRIAAGDDDPDPLDVALHFNTNAEWGPPLEGGSWPSWDSRHPDNRSDAGDDAPAEPEPVLEGPDLVAKDAFAAFKRSTGNGTAALNSVVMTNIQGSPGWFRDDDEDMSPFGPRLAAKLAQLEWK